MLTQKTIYGGNTITITQFQGKAPKLPPLDAESRDSMLVDYVVFFRQGTPL